MNLAARPSNPPSTSTLNRISVLVLSAVVTMSAVAALLPAEASAAQFNATVRGKVVDADGNPIEGVTVTIRLRAADPTNPREPVVLTTDEDGNYYARNVSLGESVITYEMDGLETAEETRVLRAGPVRIDIEMNPVEVPEEFVRAQVVNDAYSSGVDAFNSGDFAAAVDYMDQALSSLEDTPDNAEALAYIYALKGAAHGRQREFEAAIEAFTRRLAYTPDDAAANLDLAQAIADNGDEAAARPYFEAALALDPNDPITQYNVGVTMVNAGDVEGGIARIEAAIELQPEYPLAYKNLGYAYARIQEYAKAVDAFEKYVEQAPDAEDVAQINDFIAALKDMIGE